MSWNEFCTLLSGLGPKTSLGEIVQIRSEKDKEILKHFTPQQKKIRNDWQKRKIKKVTNINKYNNDMAMFEKMFSSLSKVEEKK